MDAVFNEIRKLDTSMTGSRLGGHWRGTGREWGWTRTGRAGEGMKKALAILLVIVISIVTMAASYGSTDMTEPDVEILRALTFLADLGSVAIVPR